MRRAPEQSMKTANPGRDQQHAAAEEPERGRERERFFGDTAKSHIWGLPLGYVLLRAQKGFTRLVLAVAHAA